jgi:Peptidase A4 family
MSKKRSHMRKVEAIGHKDQEAEVLRHFRVFKAPPSTFNVTTASKRELVVHGLPPRPNSRTHPQLAAKWQRISEHRLHFIQPELRVIPSIRRTMDLNFIARRKIAEWEFARYYEKFARKYSGEKIADIDIERILAKIPETSTNWSGAYVKRPIAEPLMTVTSEWRVPSVNPPASAWNGTGYNDGTYLCSVWVGIDGTQGTNDVMQAGTFSQCVVSGGTVTSTTFSAWTEWFSLPSVAVSNFPVQVGDLISCTVCAPFGSTHGTAMFNNLTSGATTNIGIDPPAGTSLVGNVAEWIVEDPSQFGGGLFPFPDYGSTFFSDCTAGSKNIELDLGSGKEIDLVDAANNVISTASIESNRTLFCRHVP